MVGADLSMSPEERAVAHEAAVAEMQGYVATYDADNSGTVTFPEFWELTRGQRSRIRIEASENEKNNAANKFHKLPKLNKNHFKKQFDQWDKDQDGSINDVELHDWMLAVRAQRQAPEPTMDVAEAIVAGHDSNNDGILDLQELQEWIHEGSLLAESERVTFGLKSDIFKDCIEFLENIKGLNNEQLKEKFNTYGERKMLFFLFFCFFFFFIFSLIFFIFFFFLFKDTEQVNGLTSSQLLQWLIDEHETKQQLNQTEEPSLKDARAIIEAHDDNNDGLLQYSEIENWFEQGALLSYTERQNYSKQGKIFKSSISFMENCIVDSSLEELKELPAMNAATLQFMFSKFDSDQDGALDSSELLKWMMHEAKLDGVQYITDVINHR